MKYLLEELFSQVVVPVVLVVVQQQESARVEVGNSPNTVFVVGAQVSNTALLGWWNDFEMGGFVNLLVSDTVQVDSLDENEFLQVKQKRTLSFE